MASYPNNSNAIIRAETGQLVTPTNKAARPQAAHKDGANPAAIPTTHPKEAPMDMVGTISPPLNPAPRTMAVNTISKERFPSLPALP